MKPLGILTLYALLERLFYWLAVDKFLFLYLLQIVEGGGVL